jgi:hypothetical protein
MADAVTAIEAKLTNSDTPNSCLIVGNFLAPSLHLPYFQTRYFTSVRDDLYALISAGRRVLDTLDRMSEIFLPHDPLLRSAGVFPVYYWFVREADTKQDQYVREFLNAFESSRRENRERAANPSTASSANSELLTFDRFNRSTDDERSHAERLRILAKRFREFLSKSRK